MSNEIEYTAPSPREAATIRWHLRNHVKTLNDREVERALVTFKPEGEAEAPSEQHKAIYL